MQAGDSVTSQRRPRVPALLGLVLLLTGAVTAATPLSVERVAFETGAKSAQPSVAVDPAEGFVVTWQERDGERSALRFAVIDKAGRETRRGLVSSGSDRFINGADFPHLAVLDNGDWVTFWLQKTAPGTYAYEIRTVRSRDKGLSWEPAVVVHRDGTPTEHGFVSMAPAGDDRVRLVWLDGRRMAASADAHGEGGDEHMTLRSAVLARDGAPTQEKELDALTCACCQTDMVRSADVTLAVYRDRSAEEIRDIGAIVFDATGTAEATPVHADAWTMHGCPVNGPALAARADRFLTAWPTMADGAMEVRLALRTETGFGKPTTLAKGAAEVGRIDAAAFGPDWLVSRVATRDQKPTLLLSMLTAEAEVASETTIAGPAGGYPRMAVDGEVALLAFTEPQAGGDTRVALMRVVASPVEP
jgi:hypothetical protein